MPFTVDVPCHVVGLGTHGGFGEAHLHTPNVGILVIEALSASVATKPLFIFENG